MRTMILDLPSELVEEEILSRVPATHLKRLRSTCKRWNLLFNQQRFVMQHSLKAPKEVKALLKTADSGVLPLHLLNHRVPSLEVKPELSLVDPYSNTGAKFIITEIIHCDGLLLCRSVDQSRFVVWNPCTGQTRWIEDALGQSEWNVIGYSKFNTEKSYKVLNFCPCKSHVSSIYEFGSDSWRTLDHDISPGWEFGYRDAEHYVSVKGNAYWFITDELARKRVALFRFDFTSEKSSLPLPLPYKNRHYEILNLAAVRDEKLAVLIQLTSKSKTEVWVTSKILDGTTPVSWSLVFALDLDLWSLDVHIDSFGNFLLDEEKNVALVCERWHESWNGDGDMDKVYCLGEDSSFTQVYAEVYAEVDTHNLCRPFLLNYVPSLTQIEPIGGYKRRRIAH